MFVYGARFGEVLQRVQYLGDTSSTPTRCAASREPGNTGSDEDEEATSELDDHGGCDAVAHYRFELAGYVPKRSAPSSLASRSTLDREFLFVNSRPVDLPNVSKAIHASYRTLVFESPHQRRYPFVVLNISVPPSAYDGTPRAAVPCHVVLCCTC